MGDGWDPWVCCGLGRKGIGFEFWSLRNMGIVPDYIRIYRFGMEVRVEEGLGH